MYNLSPGSIGEVPIVDVRQLPPDVLAQLEKAYTHFVRSSGKDRTALDTAVLHGLGLPAAFLTTLHTALGSMQRLSDAILEPMAMDPAEERGWPEELRLL